MGGVGEGGQREVGWGLGERGQVILESPAKEVALKEGRRGQVCKKRSSRSESGGLRVAV